MFFAFDEGRGTLDARAPYGSRLLLAEWGAPSTMRDCAMPWFATKPQP